MTRTKETKRKDKEQKVLLDELESIKSLLVEESSIDDIPVLEEMVLEEATSHSSMASVGTVDADNASPPVTEHRAPGVLPGQQALFKDKPPPAEDSPETSHAPTSQPQSKPTQTSSENPFLPEHIRKRLSGSHSRLDYDIEENPGFNAARTTTVNDNAKDPQMSHGELIDSLIAEFMPKIEAKLRQRLIERMAHIEPKKKK